jgi:DNA-damage-inducible protein J
MDHPLPSLRQSVVKYGRKTAFGRDFGPWAGAPILTLTFAPHQSLLFTAFREWIKTYPLCNVGKLDISRCLGYNVAQEEINTMADNSVVRARIDARTKREAAAALKKIGLTVSDAFRLLLVRVAAEKALPFEPLNPNAETVAAMKAARRGELVKAGKPDKLLRSLNARG